MAIRKFGDSVKFAPDDSLPDGRDFRHLQQLFTNFEGGEPYTGDKHNKPAALALEDGKFVPRSCVLITPKVMNLLRGTKKDQGADFVPIWIEDRST